MAQKPLLAKYVQITGVVALYWVVSITTVFVNKALLSQQVVNLDAPLFVTWYQCLVSSFICFSMSTMSKMCPSIIPFPEGSPLRYEVFRKILPLSLLFTGMIAFNNLCLKYVGVAFYYIGRSLTTVFNVILSYAVLGQHTSRPSVICCAAIVSGFWLGVDQEKVAGSLSTLGTLFGVLGSLSLSMYSIYMKKVMPFVDNQIWLISYYNNVYSSIIFIPLMLMSNELYEVMNYERLWDLKFWMLMSGGGLCGFSIGYVTALQIKVTSPLTHNISGTAKACAQTVLAAAWLEGGIQRSALWWLSNVVVLGGSAAYTRVRQIEMEKSHEVLKPSKKQDYI
ncbi:GDP-fucose transporter 1 [Ischnura elegans]|uniref:GDP-fucose transporter 1 n=1 Tax=Ischnura elegans TaxID=197161 RepID=UPI001ED89AF7|nr:GDP-fucose transporter 1 [Ischnura elegans]